MVHLKNRARSNCDYPPHLGCVAQYAWVMITKRLVLVRCVRAGAYTRPLGKHYPVPLGSHCPVPVGSHYPVPLGNHYRVVLVFGLCVRSCTINNQWVIITQYHCVIITQLNWGIITQWYWAIITQWHFIMNLHTKNKQCTIIMMSS